MPGPGLVASFNLPGEGLPGLAEFLYLDVRTAEGVTTQAASRFQEDLMPRIFRTTQLIPQVLRDTFR